MVINSDFNNSLFLLNILIIAYLMDFFQPSIDKKPCHKVLHLKEYYLIKYNL